MAIGEFGFIEWIRSRQPELQNGMEGIGDDAAIIPIGDDRSMVVTCDALVEDVHFRMNWISAYQLGRKSAAVNLSDVAAMGVEPAGLFLSLSIPKSLPDCWKEQFVSGVESWNVPLLGGDTTSSTGGVYINITAIGIADKANIKRRSTAQAGNFLYVTGNLGDSAGGLYVLEHNLKGYDDLVAAHLNPCPRISEGLALGKCPNVTAMMDISDGLAGDAGHIAEMSSLMVKIDCNKVPVSESLRRLCSEYDLDIMLMALSGGEDYQLLFTADGQIPVEAVKVGEICGGENRVVLENNVTRILYRGYNHF